MYRKIYECRVKMWQSDATGKRALKWITMPVEKAIEEVLISEATPRSC